MDVSKGHACQMLLRSQLRQAEQTWCIYNTCSPGKLQKETLPAARDMAEVVCPGLQISQWLKEGPLLGEKASAGAFAFSFFASLSAPLLVDFLLGMSMVRGL